MPDNELHLDVDTTDFMAKTAQMRAELAQITAQVKELKSALSDATGTNRSVIQGALTGLLGRVSSIQGSLGTAQASANIGVGAGAAAAFGILGGAMGQAAGPSVGGPAMSALPGVLPVNPALAQGVFASGFVAWRSGIITPGGGGGGALVMAGGSGNFGGGGGGGALVAMGQPGGMMPGFGPGMQYQAPQRVDLSGGQQVNIPGIPFPYQNFRQPMNLRPIFGAAGYLATSAASDYFNFQTQRTLHGGDSPTASAAMIGGFVGGAGGLALGALSGNPYIAIAAMATGSQLGASYFRSLSAPDEARQQNFSAIRGFFGSYSGPGAHTASWALAGDRTRPGMFGESMSEQDSSRFARFAQTVDRYLPRELEFGHSGAGVGQIFSNVASGLFAGGIDPMQDVGGYQTTIYPNYNLGGRNSDDARASLRGFMTQAAGGKNRTLEIMAAGSEVALRDKGYPYSVPSEPLAMRYTRRLGQLFGNEAEGVSKAIAPIFSTLPETGGNVADILNKYGPENTSTFLRIQREDLIGSVEPMTLSRASAGMRAADRQARLAGLLPLGSGAAAKNAFANKMLTISTLGPDAMKSESYNEAYAGFRSGRAQQFEQETLSGFGLRQLALSGESARMDYMPFAPGNKFANSLAQIQNNRGQIGRLNRQLSLGDLSESERYGLESQRQGLMTENARNVGLLSEGFENRLPALSAGRPGFAGRYNSVQGAAINLGMIGSPIRAYGAGNGRQAAAQEAFVRGLGGDSVAGAQMPYSRTSELNTTNEILSRILAAVSQPGGSGTAGRNRPTDARNKTRDNASGGDLPDPAMSPY